LAIADIPSHNHTFDATNNDQKGAVIARATASAGTITPATSFTGGGGAHSHSLSNNIKYYDFIIATKN
jgi:microcystin-dependent protein